MSEAPIVDIPQAQVTADTKFRRGGFKPAAEIIAETEQAEAAGVTPPAEEPADAVMAAAIEADTLNYETPEGVTVTGMGETEVTEPETEAAPTEAPKFKIGSREFTNQEEAWAYAEQMEQERNAADAFRQGVEAASRLNPGNPPPQAAVPLAPQEIDPEYYTNPEAYFTKREQELIVKAKAAVQQDLTQRQTHEATWSQFYSDYPDLSSAREFVDLTLQQNWDTLRHVETKQALKQLAEKTRAKLKPIIEARMPKTQLPKVTTAASPGGTQQVTPKAAAKPALNFTQQMKNLRKNRTQLR